MKLSILNFLVFVALLIFHSSFVYANNLKAEEEIYGQFESICLSFMNDYSRALPIINSIGKKIDDEKASKFIYPQTCLLYTSDAADE